MRKKQNAIQEDKMVQQVMFSVDGRCWVGAYLYDMSLVKIGSSFVSQMEGQNFQQNIFLKLGRRYDWEWA